METTVRKPRRKMKDEFVLQGNYGYGWSDECTEDTRRAINERMKEYRKNAGSIGQHRIIVRRVPV